MDEHCHVCQRDGSTAGAIVIAPWEYVAACTECIAHREALVFREVTTVVNRRTQPFDVYIGRPSPWGNPYVIGPDGTRTEVIAKYHAWLLMQPHLLEVLDTLRGKRLGCWCAPKACHGDILAAMANALP